MHTTWYFLLFNSKRILETVTRETLSATRPKQEQEDMLGDQPDMAVLSLAASAVLGRNVVFVGAGQNTQHMQGSITRLNRRHPVHVFEVAPPQISASSYDSVHFTNTEEGRRSAELLLGSGAVHAVYVSVVPSLHVPVLTEHLENVGKGLVDFVVVAKPAVQSLEEMRIVDRLEKLAIEKRKQTKGLPNTDPVLFIHEHYPEKGAWRALREQLGEMTDRLGRLHSFTVDIEEARTAESEGRTDAFAGGALEDLGPHVISLGLDIQSSINKKSKRYHISDRSRTSVERFRYEDSDLPEGVETGFIVRGTAEINDKKGTAHDIQFAWRGGKGLVDSKKAVLEFEHPDTGERTTITVNLRDNTLDVPESLRDLFPDTKFDDNGYGSIVEIGLNGGNPNESFQSWDEARVVTKWQHVLARQGRDVNPLVHPQGASFEELEKPPLSIRKS